MNRYSFNLFLFFVVLFHLLPMEVRCQLRKPSQEKSTIWENDFSNHNDWVMANETDDNQNWVITSEDGPNIGYDTGGWEDVTNSISNENGYALYDSDALGANGGQNATISYFQPIDLSNYSNVVLRFHQRGKLLTDTKNFVEISTDSVNWTSYQVNMDKIISIGFEEIEQINITTLAGNQPAIYLRFRFIGAWDYAWMIDDVEIIEQPENDIVSLNFGIIGEHNDQISYGSTPLDQMDQSYVASGSVYNFGLLAQDSVTLSGFYTNASDTIPFYINSQSVLENDDTLFLSAPFQINNPQMVTYEGYYSFDSSEEDSSSTEYYNNFGLQNFELTEALYAQDFMSTSISPNVSPVGTEDYGHPVDTYFATLYHFRAGTNIVSGFQIPLHPDSEAGGEIEISIMDTASFFANELTPYIDLNNQVALSAVAQIGSDEIDAGEIIVAFDTPISLPDGAFYAVVRPMNPGNSALYLYDDLTIEQPSIASMVSTLELGLPTVNEDGNSFAIRLLMGDQTKIQNLSSNNILIVSPNPANETATIALPTGSENFSIRITDPSGKLIWQQQNSSKPSSESISIDCDIFASGCYTVTVETINEIVSKNLLIQH